MPSGDVRVCGSLRQSCGHTAELLGLTAPSGIVRRLVRYSPACQKPLAARFVRRGGAPSAALSAASPLAKNRSLQFLKNFFVIPACRQAGA